MYFYNYVLCIMHGPGSNGKRRHGNFKQENIGGKNFHKIVFL